MRIPPRQIIRRFAAYEGAAARESFRCYFDLKRRAEGKPPMQLVEVEGVWYAVEPGTMTLGHDGADEENR